MARACVESDSVLAAMTFVVSVVVCDGVWLCGCVAVCAYWATHDDLGAIAHMHRVHGDLPPTRMWLEKGITADASARECTPDIQRHVLTRHNSPVQFHSFLHTDLRKGMGTCSTKSLVAPSRMLPWLSGMPRKA